MARSLRNFKPRRYMTIVISGIFITMCFYLYTMIEYSGLSGIVEETSIKKDDLLLIKSRLQEMEASLGSNEKTILEMKDVLKDLAQHRDKVDWKKLYKLIDAQSEIQASYSSLVSPKLDSVMLSADTCSFANLTPPVTDVQMVDVFNSLPFDNPDGGVWKQGYPIHYREDQWKTRNLKVFIVPHSHNDPGWLKTFEQYYEQQTRSILSLMVDKLEQYPKMRFIYAEMSFFSMWWAELEPDRRARVRKLLEENRLEIVTGGWVMTDEANAHYFAMVDQLVEGNQWLVNEVGVKPQSGWAIDPFGHSPTMAYLLRLTGLQNMLIQRVHYSVKKHLSLKKQLEFAWRQNWDRTGRTDMFCHMMPFYSYDVPHTCGPDPAICCQFDFKRLPGGRVNCPWRIPPVSIEDHNVAERAKTLLHQYRAKAQLYQNDVVLIPLGDDFRYESGDEWDKQYTNYQKLFDYMNQQSDWNVEAQFGTLSDYFVALRDRAQPNGEKLLIPPGYPTLSGDFYTYADRDDNYWSGYYTSRPFYKQLDRVLEAHLRAGEIIYSLALAAAHRHKISNFPQEQLMSRCVSARRYLGLFQHHDGITGTAKDVVVADYGLKLLEALNNMKNVIATSAQFLLTDDKAQYTASNTLDVDEKRESHDSLPEKTVINLSSSSPQRSVVVYNSLGHSRIRAVRVLVNVPHIELRDSEDNVIESQIEPFISGTDISTEIYKLVFLATVPAFGISRYTVKQVEANTNVLNSFATLTIYGGSSSDYSQLHDLFQVKHVDTRSPSDLFDIENSQMKASFNAESGMLKDIKLKASETTVKMDSGFVFYGTRSGKERSGAYLFLPNGEAEPILDDYSKIIVRVVRGNLASEVHSALPVVEQTIRLTNSPGVDGASLEVINLVDIQTQSNYELAMRLKTDVVNNDEFYTDLNGFQMQKRTTYSKLPLQANVYPMPAMAYIQDKNVRVSILSAQSLGVSSLQKGWLEVMQDRRLDQDDNRGLQQPVRDNKRTPNRFRILVEKRLPDKATRQQPAGFPSLLGHFSSADLVHRFYVMLPAGITSDHGLSRTFHPLSSKLPCDLDVINLRTIPRQPSQSADIRSASALILHRIGIDCSFKMHQSSTSCQPGWGNVSLSSFGVETARRTSLTMLENFGVQDTSSVISLPPMELQTFVVTLR